jgi:hypothetical protein
MFVLVQGRLRSAFHSAELGLGAGLVWLVLLLTVSALMPGASFLLLWPLLAVLGSFIACSLPWGQRQTNSVRAAILLLGVAPGILLFAPFVRQIYIALTPQLVGVAVLLLVLLLGLMSPLLSMLAGRRIVPMAALAAGVALMAGAGSTAGFSTERPRPTNLSYVQQGNSGTAYWLSSDRDLDAWTKAFFPNQTFGSVPEVFGHTNAERYFASAPGRGLARPTAEVLGDVVADGKRTLTLRLKSARQAPKVTVRVEGADVLQSGFEDRALGGTTPANWQLDVFGVPDGGNVLRITVAEGKPFKVRLTDTSYGLALNGIPARRSDLIAQPFRDSDTTRVVNVIAFE